MKKVLTAVVATAILIPVVVFAGWFDRQPSAAKSESQVAEENHQRFIRQIPIPNLQDSLERRNVAKRAELFNDNEKISYIYLTSFGKVMAFYTVKGKVSSLRSYLNPTDRLVRGDGSRCSGWSEESGCHVTEAPEIDGTYGENPHGIFFFTTEGAYVEWNGEYMVSDQPLKLTTPPELVREVK